MAEKPIPHVVDLGLIQPRLGVAEGLVHLAHWRAFLLSTPGRDVPGIHLVGVNMRTGRSRVSSPVARLDPSARCVATDSGRVYSLRGEHGHADVSLALLRRLTEGWDARLISDVTVWLFGARDSSLLT